jgi:mono/diheme cytochrome c family protein
LAKDFPGIRVDALLDQIVANGVAGSVMPAWSKAKGGPLADTEINDIVAYIRSLGHQAPTAPATLRAPTTIAPAPSPVATFPAGNTVRGSKVFADNCAACHGDKGEGRIGASLQKDWPGINVDAFLDTTIARGVAGSKMPAWSKAYGGPLTDQEIADAAAFVRTLRVPTQAAPSPEPENAPSGQSSLIGLICFGEIVLVGGTVLAIGLAASRAKKLDSD